MRALGHADFTVLGRPSLDFVSVVCSVLEQTFSEKVIVFKKKRRKGYKRWQGHKQTMTVLRVERLEYSLPEALAQRAVSLV